MLNIEQLLAPISEEQPCGADMAFSSEFDAIANARVADDPTLEQGAWVAPLKEADWKFVMRRCSELLATRTKDLQLAAWLLEAQARTEGLGALAQGLALTAGLCERHWDGLYPLRDEDGDERRIGILHWIATRVVTLVQDMPLAFDESTYQDAGACLAALVELARVLDEKLGADGPSLGKARAAIEAVAGRCQVPQQHASAHGTRLAVAEPAPLAPTGIVMQREQALAQLRELAGFFRRTEPHSPVAYLVDKAAQWGEQPLHAWLRAVIKDDAALSRVEELLGIERGG